MLRCPLGWKPGMGSARGPSPASPGVALLWFGEVSDCAEALGGLPLLKIKLRTSPH